MKMQAPLVVYKLTLLFTAIFTVLEMHSNWSYHLYLTLPDSIHYLSEGCF